MPPSSLPPRVFVSYAHDSANPQHSQRVTQLVEDLRANGIDARFDRDINGTPEKGWPSWMEENVQTANFVLVVCSETYLRRYEGREKPGTGKGATWEGQIIRQELYDSTGTNAKFAAVLFDPKDEQYKPSPLRPHTHYSFPASRETLLRWLTAQRAYNPRPLGTIPLLPPNP